MNWRRDDARLHVLEAVLVAFIMMESAVFLSTFRLGGSSLHDEPNEALYEGRAKNTLDVLYDTPRAKIACGAESNLDQAVLDGVHGNSTMWDAKTDFIIGEHTQHNLHLHNRFGEYPLHREFEGLANAAARRNYAPDWSYALAMPRTSGVGGTERLVVDAIGVENSQIAGTLGEPVQFTLTLSNGQQIVTYGQTSPLRPDHPHVYAQNLTFEMEDESPGLVMAPSLQQVSGADPRPMEFRLRVDPRAENGGAQFRVPAGTNLTLHFPPRWSEPTFEADGWTHNLSGDDALGWSIRLTLTEDRAGSQRIWVYSEVPPVLTRPFDVVTAELHRGSLSRSSLVVTYPNPVERGLPRVAYAMTPYPVPMGASALFGVVLANGGEKVNVTRVDVTVPGGYDFRRPHPGVIPLFAEGRPVAIRGWDGGNWSWVDDRHIRWVGSRTIEAGKAADWIVGVNTSVSEVSSRLHVSAGAGVASRWVSDGFVDETRVWGGVPGVLRHEIVPDSPDTVETDGYPWSLASGASSFFQSFSLRVDSWRARLETNTSYRVVADASDLVRLEGALGNASVVPRSRSVPLGGVYESRIDLESVLTTLSKNGITNAKIRADVYAPPTLGCRPIASYARDATSLPRAGIRAVQYHDAEGAGVASVYALADDNRAYKVDVLGRAVWAQAYESRPTALLVHGQGQGAFMLVGERDGTFHRHDPVLNGERAWTQRVVAGQAPLLEGVVAFRVLPGWERFLVQADNVIEVRNYDGTLHARRTLGLSANAYVQTAFDAGGDVWALDTHALLRLHPDLSLRASYPIEDALGFTLTNQGVYVTRGQETLRLARGDLSLLGRVEHLAPAALVASGEATGDSWQDHLVTLTSLTTLVTNGATGETTTHQPTLPAANDANVALDFITSATLERVEYDEPATTTTCSTNSPVTYQESEVCVSTPNPEDLQPLALQLHAADGHATLTYRLGALTRASTWHLAQSEPHERQFPLGSEPTSLTSTSLLAAHTLLAGLDTGVLHAWNTPLGETVLEAAPSPQVGRFVLRTPVPVGGFFGAHVVVTTLAWTDPAQGAREARMIDWFEVTDPGGQPVPVPFYVLHLRVRDPFLPPEVHSPVAVPGPAR